MANVFGSAVWTIARNSNAAQFASHFPNCADREARLAALTAHMRAHNRERKITHRIASLNMRRLFGDDSASGWPCLQGPGIKAANTRASVSWLLVLVALFDDGTPMAKNRYLVVKSMDDSYKTIYSVGVVLTRKQFLRQYFFSLRALRAYNWLALDACYSGVLAWHTIPKLHYFAELCRRAELLNPRFTQTYAGESFVGRVMPICKRALNGPHANTFQRTVITKYLSGVEIDARGAAFVLD